MGMRHVIVVDGNLFIVGMITRSDMNEHRLEHFWEQEVLFLASFTINSHFVA
jgi:hypothetical protein